MRCLVLVFVERKKLMAQNFEKTAKVQKTEMNNLLILCVEGRKVTTQLLKLRRGAKVKTL